MPRDQCLLLFPHYALQLCMIHSHSPNLQVFTLEDLTFQSLVPLYIPLNILLLGSFWSLVLIKHRNISLSVSRHEVGPYSFVLDHSLFSSPIAAATKEFSVSSSLLTVI